MMSRDEFETRSDRMETEIAIRSLELKRKFDQEYGSFVFIGTDTARAEVARQWEEAKETRFQKALRDLEEHIELALFGPAGQSGVLAMIEMLEQTTRRILIVS